MYNADIVKETIKISPEAQVFGEDYLMNFNVATMCKKIVILDGAPLYNYYFNTESVTNSYSSRKRMQEYDFWNAVYNIAKNAGCINLPDVRATVQDAYMTAIYECCISNWSMADKKKEVKEILSLITDKKILVKNTGKSALPKRICLRCVYLNLTGLFIFIAENWLKRGKH